MIVMFFHPLYEKDWNRVQGLVTEEIEAILMCFLTVFESALKDLWFDSLYLQFFLSLPCRCLVDTFTIVM